MKPCVLLVALLGVCGAFEQPIFPQRGGLVRHPVAWAPLRLRTSAEEVVIDGKETTIGVATAYYLAGLLDSSWDILGKILNVLLPPSPEEDIHYFDLIKEDVEQLVGQFMDYQNMQQIEVYKDSLGVLLQRYIEAPEESSTYPDKSTVANSLSTSIIANRFLVEGGQYPHSLMIHYADIASIHILVLKDVADTYTSLGTISAWWLDLDQQLDHYITYGIALQSSTIDWRNDLMTCSYSEGRDYDEWTVEDLVAELVDTCLQVHGTHSCDDHCQAYQINMNREASQFAWHYMGKALREWEALKLLSAQMVKHLQP